ncbi:MAG: hypothetical protein VB084_01700 [Syntrophomonadaceae bacterium]|nr:hypothetical protein [Syntrophomonadaceae bacterium]
MAGFFDKLKQGVSETGKQAKVAVETNRLKMQISMKQKEIESKYTAIGQLVYKAYRNDDFSSINSELENIYHEIMACETDIEAINNKILEVKNTKECVCGNMVPAETRFCPQCGYHFKLDDSVSAEPIMDQVDDNQRVCSCGNVMASNAKFCTACGKKF